MISFIIPAHNEERLLGLTLTSIRNSVQVLGEPFEVIVVDDASSDQTAVIAEQNGARVISVSHRQIAAARNSGAKNARGDIFIFVDADTVINDAVIRAVLNALQTGAIGGGSGVQFEGSIPLYARLLLPLVLGIFRIARFASGCFIFSTRNAFEAAGGFDETMFGAEEIRMSQALKRQGRFDIVREAVVTSGRKLRAYSGWEILTAMSRLALGGPKSVRTRNGMSLWYDKRRNDPEDREHTKS